MVDEIYDNTDFYPYEGFGMAKGNYRGREVFCLEDSNLNLVLEKLHEVSKDHKSSYRMFKPLMSSCSRVTVEICLEDKRGHKVEIKGEFERDKDPNSNEVSTQAPDTDSKPDSWDRDFDKR